MFRWLKEQDLILKVQIGLLVMGLMMLFTVSLSIYKTLSINDTLSKVTDLRVPTAQNSLQLLNGLNHSLAALRGWMLLGQDKFKDERKHAWASEISPSLNNLADLSKNWTNPENIKRLKKIRRKMDAFKKYQAEIEAVALSTDNLPATKILTREVIPVVDAMTQSISSIINIELTLKSDTKRKKMLGIMADLRATTVKALALASGYLADNQKRFLTNYNNNWNRNSENLDMLSGYQSLLSSKQNILFKRFMKDRNNFVPLVQKIFSVRSSRLWNRANYLLATKAAPIAFSIKEDISYMVANQADLQKQDLKESQDVSAQFITTLWMVFVLMLLFTLFFIKIIAEAIKKPFEELALQNTMQEDIRWVQEGVLQLNEVLAGDSSVEEVSLKGLTRLSTYLQASIGLIYLFEESSKRLSYLAGFAYDNDVKQKYFNMGEGSIGQVALQKEPLFMENLEHSTLKVTHGIGKSDAMAYTYPLMNQDEVLAVIEFGTTRQLDDKALELIEQASHILVSAMLSAQQNQNVKDLLEHTEHVNAIMAQKQDAVDSHSIMGITDIKGTITFANSKFSEVSGYSNEELVGANHRIVNSGTYDDDFWKEMYGTVSKGEIWHHPAIKNKKKDGSFYWVDTTIFPFMGVNGKPESYIAIRTDVTKAKEAEVELLKAKEDAEMAAKAKADFLASMSHEIRTPMNGVLGMLDLISREKLTKKQFEKIDIATSSAKSLLSVINDILDFSKIEAGKIELESIEVDIEKELGKFAKSIVISITNHEVELLLDVSGLQSSYLYLDIGRVKQVLNNLVGNAIKFTHTGNIVISASLEKRGDKTGTLTLCIEDSGIGISKEKLTTLFDAFSQADSSTTRKYGGTGLGLSIAKKLVELMGGQLSVESTLGKGSKFSATIEVELSTKELLTLPNSDIRGKKILIVDDNMINIEILQSQLELWGIDVSYAYSPAEAIEICEKRDEKEFFDIAILDMQMPDMDGETLGVELKTMSKAAGMGMIMMTSYGEHEDVDTLYKKGFNAYFMKPTTSSDLYDALMVLSTKDYKKYEDNTILTKAKLNAFESQKIENSQDVKILLVEDNRTNQLVAQGILESLNLQADIANDGQEALDTLNNASIKYDVVLMDCQMPVLDGYEATAAIRAGKAGEAYKDLTVIAMTANAMEGDKEKCIDAGMNDYITKPIVMETFRNTLLKWMKLAES